MNVRSICRLSLMLVGVAALIISGCIGPQVRQAQEPTPPPKSKVDTEVRIIYYVPKSKDLVPPKNDYSNYLNSLGLQASAISTSNYVGGGYTEAFRNEIKFRFDKQNKTLTCTKANKQVVSGPSNSPFQPSRYEAFVAYSLDYSVEEKPDKFVVTLIPREKETKAARGWTSIKIPQFTETELIDLLSTSAIVTFKIEVDAPYDKDSVIANFRRVLGGTDKSPYKNQEERAKWAAQDKMFSDTKKGEFVLKNSSYTAKLSVEVWPFKGGSKAVVTIDLKGSPTSTEPTARHIDMGKLLDEARQEVEKIVKG